MKDKIARQLIAKIIKQIELLQKEINAIKNPHPPDCQCDICTGLSPDYLSILSIEEIEALQEE